MSEIKTTNFPGFLYLKESVTEVNQQNPAVLRQCVSLLIYYTDKILPPTEHLILSRL